MLLQRRTQMRSSGFCQAGVQVSSLATRVVLQARAKRKVHCKSSTEFVQTATQLDAISQPHAHEIQVYYRTNWPAGYIHGSLEGGSWQDFELKKVSGAPGRLLSATIVPTGKGGGSTALLEFVVSNSSRDNWDKPKAGGNYVITEPGVYSLRGGSLQSAAGRPVMVVSDLDGTMIGDDASTSAFRNFWEEKGLPRGGVLVYNTGRSLDSFMQLMKDKAHCMAHPQSLISAVGTKVYNNDGSGWKEDRGWTSLLDDAWNISTARDAGYKALAQVGKDLMHFRPPEEQNDHKVTCGVNVSVLDKVLGMVNKTLADASVQANIITSGHGDWRFLDIVPIKAGKLEALNYVRKQYNFPVGSTVACGDSGNDILMLAGENPAIVVGNAQPDLRRWVEERRKVEPAGGAGGGKERLFVAKKHEAHGILEGLEYLGFL